MCKVESPSIWNNISQLSGGCTDWFLDFSIFGCSCFGYSSKEFIIKSDRKKLCARVYFILEIVANNDGSHHKWVHLLML